MSFQEEFEEFLDEAQGFATWAVIMPATSRSYKVKGIFSNDYLSLGAGITGISGSNPVFECAAKSISNLEYGDLLRLADVTYRIIGIMPDGTGWAKLDLEQQDGT